jgi:hypothetical protein
MVLTALSLVACTLYLVPLLALLALLRNPNAGALDLASKLGTSFALDLLGTFALMRVMRLEQAVFLRTTLLLGAVTALTVRRLVGGRRVFCAQSALSRADFLAIALAALFGFTFNHSVSSEYLIWDRDWHVPFTASLRSQHLPIFNVYEPGRPFRYHLIGDLSGATLQVLSFGAMNAARALAFAHDLQAMLLAVMIALSFRALSGLSVLTTSIAASAPLLAGPLAYRPHSSGPFGVFEGYADFNTLSLSYRPHCMVALVLIVGTFCHVAHWSRYRARGQTAPWSTVASLGPIFMLLGIADEISATVLGSSLGLVWLCWPRMLGKRFWHGLVVLVAFAALALLANLVLAGTLAPGGVVSHVQLLSPRLPRFLDTAPPLGLAGEPWVELFVDIAPIVIPIAAIATYLVIDRRARSVRLTTLTCFTMCALVVSLFLFLCVEVNGRTFEGHRFLTATRLLAPLFGLSFLVTGRRTSFALVAVLVPILGGIFATLGYVCSRLPQYGFLQTASQYGANCRVEYNARLGEVMRPTWVEEPIWYEYAGCHPLYAAADRPPGDVVLVGSPAMGRSGFAKMDDNFFPRGEEARMICSSDSTKTTDFCQHVQKIGRCHAQGTLAVECLIPAAERAKLRKL